jgi:spore maturation protein SpmB
VHLIQEFTLVVAVVDQTEVLLLQGLVDQVVEALEIVMEAVRQDQETLAVVVEELELDLELVDLVDQE